MQVLFMIAAGAVVAPFIFGLVTTIIEFLMSQSLQALAVIGGSGIQEATLICGATSGSSLAYWECIKETITLLLVVYIIIEVIAVGFMVSMIRTGSSSKSFIYIPVLLLIAYVVYYGTYTLTVGEFGR